MNIENFSGGFVQYYDNKVIEKITFKEDNINVGIDILTVNRDEKISKMDKFEYTRTCMVYFHNRRPKELNNIKFCGVYNRQYGIPVSEDGSKLFVGVWERGESELKRGLCAYDIESDSLLWHVNEGRIRQVFVYSNYLIALSAANAIFKINIEDGVVSGKIKSGTIENIIDIGFPYIFVDELSGKLCVIDVEDMSTVKNYGSPYKSKIVNPLNCHGISIYNVVLKDDVLIVSGSESYPNGVGIPGPNDLYDPYAPYPSEPFERVLDADFFATLSKGQND